MADTVDHTHGDTGVKPPQDLNFQSGDLPDPEVFDWFWNEVPAAINDHASRIEALGADSNGVVDEAEYAQNTDSFKGNDLDSDGDGKVDAAETADTAKDTDSFKGNDLDTDGDGKVDAADTADTASAYKNTDIDTNGDGKVDAADTADSANTAATVKGNDIDSDGDGQVDAADTADAVKGNDIDTDGDGRVNAADEAATAEGLTNVSHSELADAPSGAHHARYSDAEARSAVDGSDVTVGTATKIPVRSSDPSNPEEGEIWIIA